MKITKLKHRVLHKSISLFGDYGTDKCFKNLANRLVLKIILKENVERDKILEKYMKMYDQRIKYFGQKGFVLGRKGTAWLEYKLHETRENSAEGEALKNIYKKGYEWVSESIKEQGGETGQGKSKREGGRRGTTEETEDAGSNGSNGSTHH